MITPELEAEGFAREISRKVQAERKARGMKKEQRIDLELFVSDKLKACLAPYLEFISQRTGSRSARFTDDKPKLIVSFDVKNETIGFKF